jgi:hypothetical protein
MEPAVRRLVMNTLKAQAVLRNHVCSFLAKEIGAVGLTAEERAEIHDLWREAVRDEQTLRAILERAERGETLT